MNGGRGSPGSTAERWGERSGGLAGGGADGCFVPGWLPSGSLGVHGNQVSAAGALVQRNTNTKSSQIPGLMHNLGPKKEEGGG